MFLLMIVVAVAIGGADIARAMFGFSFVIGLMLVIYYFLIGVFGDR